MRIEEYTRDLIENDNGEFMVLGSVRDWNSHKSNDCAPLKMSRSCFDSGSPYGADLDELIRLADSDCFLDDPQTRKMFPEFQKHYPEIFRGECPDWQLGALKVFYGGIHLDYGNRRTGETAFLWIVGARQLRLTFEAPRTRLGFVPIYKVSIDCEEDGQSETLVEEDLGYLRREIRFELKDPSKKTDIFHSGNQYLIISEYAGI